MSNDKSVPAVPRKREPAHFIEAKRRAMEAYQNFLVVMEALDRESQRSFAAALKTLDEREIEKLRRKLGLS
jgi:hypothetical protein